MLRFESPVYHGDTEIMASGRFQTGEELTRLQLFYSFAA